MDSQLSWFRPSRFPALLNQNLINLNLGQLKLDELPKIDQ